MARCLIVAISFWLAGLAWPAAAPARGNPLFGVSMDTFQGVTARDFREVRDLGAGTVRMAFWWSDLEPRRGRYDFGGLDWYVARARRNGLEPVVTLIGSARHACRLPRAQLWTCPPRLRPYRTFLRRVASRYRGRVRYWEIWNEQNIASEWPPAADPASYAELLHAAYTAIKSVDRRAQVITGPAAGTDLGFYDGMLAALGGRRAFDLVGVHPYRFPSGPWEASSWYTSLTLKDELLELERIFQAHGYGRPGVVVTELGWGAGGDVQAGHRDLVTLEQQARYLTEIYTLFSDDPEMRFVQRVCWFNVRDGVLAPSDPIYPFNLYGLLYRDFTPKPAALAFRALAAGG